jgi:hypothetical protein
VVVGAIFWSFWEQARFQTIAMVNGPKTFSFVFERFSHIYVELIGNKIHGIVFNIRFLQKLYTCEILKKSVRTFQKFGWQIHRLL